MQKIRGGTQTARHRVPDAVTDTQETNPQAHHHHVPENDNVSMATMKFLENYGLHH